MSDQIRFRESANRKIATWFLVLLPLLPIQADAENRQERESWTYHKDWDKLNNLNFSYTRSPKPKRELYDNIRLEILCKNNVLQLITESKSLITPQGREFDFEYQIDKKPPVTIKMKTFNDSKRRGYTDEQVSRIADELLSGQSVFIRINTIISTVLSAVIPLNDTSGSIQQVLTDCGMQAGKAPEQVPYQLTDFEREFNALSPEHQLQALEQIKKIMDNFH